MLRDDPIWYVQEIVKKLVLVYSQMCVKVHGVKGLAKDEAGRAGKNKILEEFALHTMKFRFY